ncbi:MAG: hypothetical protein Q9164_003603 [Protoblastenia rupestris]
MNLPRDAQAKPSTFLPEQPKEVKKEKPKKQAREIKALQQPKPASLKEKVPVVLVAPADPTSMFKEGFLKSVYDEKPSESVQAFQITYSSDNFDKLYILAEDLIKRDSAYVCHCTEFRPMRDRKFKPKEAFLRMNQDFDNGNPQCKIFQYGRFNVTATGFSKRKIKELFDRGKVRGWDNPRFFTLIALQRRGVPPGAILSFVNELGVSTALTNIQIAHLEQTVQRYLEQTGPRLMIVLDPIPVFIDDLADDYVEEFEVPFGKDPAIGVHKLAPGETTGLLKVPFPIKTTTFAKDEATGLITEVHATYERPEESITFKKPKTLVTCTQVTNQSRGPSLQPRFKSENPDSADGGFLNDINSNCEEVYPSAVVETGLEGIRKRAPWPEKEGEKDVASKDARFETVKFQRLRVAYFGMGRDMSNEKIVLDRIVSLKEDSGKS